MGINDELKYRHPFSRKGIFTKYACEKIVKSPATWSSLIIATSLAVYLFLTKSDDAYLSLLKKITDLSLSLFPDLLGFCIGGYALIIGVGSIDVLKKLSSPLKDSGNWSYYQILSSIFAISIIIQCFVLLFSLIISVVIDLNIEAVCTEIGLFTNIVSISAIFFFSIMSIILLYYTVVNIFNFGQLAHFSVKFDEINFENNSQTDSNASINIYNYEQSTNIFVNSNLNQSKLNQDENA